MLGATLLLLISTLVCGGIGTISISLHEWWTMLQSGFDTQAVNVDLQTKMAVLLHIRLPRVLMSIAVGAGLALAGAALQGLFRNPMADPSIIGVSAGATLFAAIAIVLLQGFAISTLEATGLSTLSVVAFIGAVLASWLVYKMATNKVETNVTTMLLAGLAINALAMAATGFLSYITDEAQLRNIVFFTMGSLGGAKWFSAIMMLLVTAIALVLLAPLGKHLNALALGEQEALALGTPLQSMKKRVVLVSSALIGVAVAFTGVIGFVGLVIPHLLRLAGIKDYRFLLTYAALAGGILLCWTDTLSRTLVAPAEMPIGIITSILGAPIFLLLIYNSRMKLA